jgi:hypothetical protein
MNRIAAVENHIVEANADSWRLLEINELGRETIVVETSPGQALRYHEDFAMTRRLPTTGSLPVSYIRQIVVGWSALDQSWQLGLLLVPEIAEPRGSRWCQIVTWPDPDPNAYAPVAEDAGRSLAQQLGVEFRLVPPRERELPLPDLPREVGIWRVEPVSEARIDLVRSPQWARGKILRIAWYALLTIVYVVLSVATLNTDLALPNSGTMLPNPELLPYLGLVVAAGLIVGVLYMIYELLTCTTHIVVDGQQKRILGLRSGYEKWGKTGDEIDSIYVSQVVRDRRNRRVISHGEINLHTRDGAFHRLLLQPETNSESLPADAVSGETLFPLRPINGASTLQSLGLHIARTLGNVACWYDQRTR